MSNPDADRLVERLCPLCGRAHMCNVLDAATSQQEGVARFPQSVTVGGKTVHAGDEIWVAEDGSVEIRSPSEAQVEEVKRLREALEFYADPRGRKDEFGDPIAVPDFYNELSFGDTATAALSAIGTGGQKDGI